MSDYQDGFVMIGGHRLHYIEAGQGPDTILLLHSGGASCHQYEAVLPALAANCRVIAWDMLGHGDSDPLPGHKTMEEYGLMVEQFAQALGLERFTLSGSSIGGYISIAYATSGTRRIERLVIVEAPLRSPQWYRENWLGFEAMCAIPENTAEELEGRFRKVTPALHKRWNVDRNKAGSWTMVDIAWACRDFATAERFAAITVPTQVLIGSKGPTVNEKALMEELRPDARITVLDDCGHFPMIDDPEGFVKVILDRG
jgi:3-oxoadipate enol-lactonase